MDYFKNEQAFMDACGYDIEGKWYPRVTKIVGIKAKPALMFYYAEAPSYKAAQAMTKISAEEGTLIHEVVQDYLVGKIPNVPESIRPSFEAFLDFQKEHNIQIDPEYVEKRVVSHDHRYAGTMDALALIGGKMGILDIKTSAGIYRDYSLQISAYMDPMVKEVKDLQTRWILRIDQVYTCGVCTATMRPKGGRNKVKRGKQTMCPDNHEWGQLTGIIELQEFPFWKNDFQAFLGAKQLWEWENDYWLKRIGYLS